MPKLITDFKTWLLDYGDRLYRCLVYKKMFTPYEQQHAFEDESVYEDTHYEFRAHPEKYKRYEAENSWGTVSGTARLFEKMTFLVV